MTIKYHHHHHPHHLERATVNLHLASQGSQNWRHSLGAHIPWSFLLCVGSSAPLTRHCPSTLRIIEAHTLIPCLHTTGVRECWMYCTIRLHPQRCAEGGEGFLWQFWSFIDLSSEHTTHLSWIQHPLPYLVDHLRNPSKNSMNLVKYEPPLHNPMLNIPNKSMIFLMQVDPILNNLLRYFPCHWCKACCFSAHS